ncbi:MAG: rod shape-determining protein [Anaerovoracaceae bacterium]|jgi:rod shape-determining protein MreB
MFFSFFKKDIGVDLGTANTLIYIKNKGIVLNEPSVIAVDSQSKNILAVGKDAKEMIGRAPQSIDVTRPLQDGVISDFDMTVAMLKAFLQKVAHERNFFTKVRIVVGVPTGVTEVEKRAVEEVIRQMGAKEVYIMEEPMAAAVGTGLPVGSAMGSMIADLGGGTSDIAIIALGGIVTSTSIRQGGDKQNEAIISYMRKKHNLIVGDKTAENIKINIGCAYLTEEEANNPIEMEARGRDILSGLPKTVTINSVEALEALEEPVNMVIEAIKVTLENAPPEISADIVENGIILSGGSSLLKGFDKLIEMSTGIKVIVAENALEAVAEGTGESLSHINKMSKQTGKGSTK